MNINPDIILYAIIAVILLARLWSVFGQRNDGDPQRPNPFATPAPDTRNAAYKPASGSIDGTAAGETSAKPSVFNNLLLPPTSLAGGLEQIQKIYPAFDEKDFLQSARQTFTKVVEDFAKGDLSAIESYLGPTVLPQFKAAIAARATTGQTMTCRITSIRDTEITAARIADKNAFITVRFVSEQQIALRDASGAVIGENDSQHEQLTDIWVFMRDTSTSDAHWVLVETRS